MLLKSTGKHLCWSLFLNQKRSSGAGFFLWILWNFQRKFFKERLRAADIMISNCSFDGKIQILIFWVQAFFCPKTRRPESKHPNSKHSGGQSSSVCTMWEDSSFSSRPIKKVLKFLTLKTQILNYLYKFRRFLSTPVPKIRFLASLIKIHYISLIFIHVNSVLLHSKTKRHPPILPVVVFPCH